jgi:hypothetical protein
MRLFSYIVARDYGFAPNPFYAVCTLATCKPRIRSSAAIGDWVIGAGAKSVYGYQGRLIFAMRVHEALTFDAYWSDPRFLSKRPVLNGSLKQVYGDNIYHKRRGRWVQADSHHSYEGGRQNERNIARDTSTDRMLIAHEFVYYGEKAPIIPKSLRPYKPTGEDVCCSGVGHRVLSSKLASAFENWLTELNEWGLQGMPIEFGRQRGTSRRH